MNGDEWGLDIEGIEEEEEEEEEEEKEEEVQSKLDMRGEGIWRNDESRQLHRRGTWRDGHGLRRYMIEGEEKREWKNKLAK